MKFSGAFSTLLVILPFFVLQVAAAPGAVEARAGRARAGRFGGFRGGKQGGNQNAKGGNKGAAAGGAAAGAAAGTAAAGGANNAAAAGAANNATAAGANNANNAAAAAGGAAAGAAAGGNEQTSLTLDPSLIGANLAQNGLGANGTEAGQVASLTSTNNFINFCAGKTITNGLQIQGGSCNPVPMGDLPGTNNQPAAKFQFPVNMQNIQPNTDFTIKMAIQNLDTGFFVNPNTNYFAAPQQLVNGVIQGHSHVVVQAINGIQDTNPADPTIFAFFKGLNAAASGGVLTADVAKGLPEGTYRLFSINTAANHQPAVGPVAQHGSFDDAVYFTVGANAASQAAQDIAAVSGQAAAAAGGAAAANNAGAAAANSAAAATNTAAGAAATGAAANNAGAAAGAAAAGAAAGQNGAKGAAAQGAAQNGKNGAAQGAAQNGKNGAAQGAAQNGKNGAAAAAAQKGQQANKAQGKGKAFGSFGQQKGKNGRRSYSREQF